MNGADGVEQRDASISVCQDGKLTKANGTSEVGHDLAETGSEASVE